MDNENTSQTTKGTVPKVTTVDDVGTNPEDRPALVKKIGKMTYIVRVHFSTTSTETFSDKVKRMLREEVRQQMGQ